MDYNDENSVSSVSDEPVQGPVQIEPEPVQSAPEVVAEIQTKQDYDNHDIAEIQKRLGGIPITGEFDEKTRLRVVKMQRRWGLTPNGELDGPTLERIYA